MQLIESDQGGSTFPGVTQRLELQRDEAREGTSYAVYTAASTLAGENGWSAIGKQFRPPLDLSWHKGIGFWLRGDGQGGAFKLQLCDTKGAMDYYITNNFTGWRYQQLSRPAQDPIDYSQVHSLTIYYNGLPGRKTVACGLDDVKALRSLDERQVVDPVVQVGEHRFTWSGTLREGQYLILWPGEPIRRSGPPLDRTRILRNASPEPRPAARRAHRAIQRRRSLDDADPRAGHAAAARKIRCAVAFTVSQSHDVARVWPRSTLPRKWDRLRSGRSEPVPILVRRGGLRSWGLRLETPRLARRGGPGCEAMPAPTKMAVVKADWQKNWWQKNIPRKRRRFPIFLP